MKRRVPAPSNEAGYAMLLVFLMAALIAIALYRELPRIAFEKQRAKEQLLIERGEQYKRAIQLYVRKFQRYPAKIEDLENTNNLRFLRKRYIDPMTGKDKWRLIHVNGGVLTDSLVPQKKPGQGPGQDQGQQANTNTFIGVGPSLGGSNLDPSQAQLNPAMRRRASDDRPVVTQEVPDQPPNQEADQDNPDNSGDADNNNNDNSDNNDNDNENQAAQTPVGSPTGLGSTIPPQPPGFINRPYPPGAYPPGGQPGAYPPGAYPPGTYPGQTGGQPYPSPGYQQPYYPGQNPNGLPGQPTYPGQPVYPGQATGVPGQAYPQQGVFPGQQAPTPFGQPAVQPGFGGGFGGGTPSPNTPNAAMQAIGNSLFGPRPGGPPGFQGGAGGAFGSGQGFGIQAPGSPQGLQPGSGGFGSTIGGGPQGTQVGGGIAGVASESQGPSIKVYNERKKYNEWEFVYDQSKDRGLAGVMGNGGVPGTSAAQLGSIPGQPAPNGVGGFGGNSGFGAQPAPNGVGGASAFGNGSSFGGGSAFGQPTPQQPQPPPPQN